MNKILPFPYETQIEVIFRDLDALGHVNNAVYFTYMETARTRFFMELFGIQQPNELAVIVAETGCVYKSPAFFGERLTVGLAVSRIGHKSFNLVYQITAEDGRLVATGHSAMVMYDYAGARTIPVPAETRERLAEFIREQPNSR